MPIHENEPSISCKCTIEFKDPFGSTYVGTSEYSNVVDWSHLEQIGEVVKNAIVAVGFTPDSVSDEFAGRLDGEKVSKDAMSILDKRYEDCLDETLRASIASAIEEAVNGSYLKLWNGTPMVEIDAKCEVAK